MKIYINNDVRTGKTLFAVLWFIEKQKKEKNAKCYANFHINLPNCFYSENMILPFSELYGSLIIIDDIWSMSNSKAILGVLTNYSGKDDIEIILIGQFYTFFAPVFRTLFEFECKTALSRDVKGLTEKDLHNVDMYIYLKGKNDKYIDFSYRDCFFPVLKNGKKQFVGKLYDTREKVKIPTERKKVEAIKQNSKNLDDLETNLSMVFSNQRKIDKYYKLLSKELNFL